MALPNVAPLIAKEFVPVKLDHDRQPGALPIELRYSKTDQGLPWFAFVDAAGNALIDSIGPKGNVGHPYQPDEVVWFRQMLKKAQHHLTDAEIDFLIKSIEEANKGS